jgi:hypothetical protein
MVKIYSQMCRHLRRKFIQNEIIKIIVSLHDVGHFFNVHQL